MHPEIAIVEVGPRPIAAVRLTTVLSKWPSQVMQALDKVYEAVKAGKVRQSGQNVMVYHPRGDGRVDIECGVETAAEFERFGEVVYCETPAGMAVTTAHIGPYGQLRNSYDAIADWSCKNGHRLAETCWEIYGDWSDDPAALRTDIFHLLRR